MKASYADDMLGTFKLSSYEIPNLTSVSDQQATRQFLPGGVLISCTKVAMSLVMKVYILLPIMMSLSGLEDKFHYESAYPCFR